MSGDSRPRRTLLGSEKKRSRLRLSNPLVQVVLFFVFVVLLLAVMSLNLGIGEEQVAGDQIGTPAAADIKATRDFTHEELDLRATEQKRAEAAAAVPSTYDFHVDLREQTVARIRKAVRDARPSVEAAQDNLVKEFEAEDAAANPVAEDPDAGGEPELDVPVPARTIEQRRKALRKARLQAAEAMRDQFDLALQTVVADEHFTVLAEAGFPAPTENALVGLVDEVMRRRLVQDKRLLEAEGKRGIRLRQVRGEAVENQARILDLGQSFLDIRDVSRELSNLAPQELAGVSEPRVRTALLAVAAQLVAANTRFNHEETAAQRKEARDGVEDLVVVTSFRKGQNIVDRGHLITPRHVKIIQKMDGAQDARLTRGQVLLGTIILVVALLVVMFLFSRGTIRKFRPSPKDMVFLGSVLLGQLALLQGLIVAFDVLGEGWSSATPQMLYYCVPMALGAMLVRLVLNSETSLIHAFVLAILAGIIADDSVGFAAFVFATSVVGAGKVGKVSQRLDLLKAGLWVGGVGATFALAIYLLRGEVVSAACVGAIIAGFVGGLISGILVNAVLPFVESVFRYTTDIKLLELADLNHPALKDLILRAPGTYHHSVVVGTLAKEAAEAINANPLLARVGSYYHDLGKGKNPQYFAENQRQGHNPHDRLKPNMSALIIKSHVKDGLEIARGHDLPREIQDFIAQHHGTTLIAYFFHRAKSQEDPDIPEVDEKDYRYPGPKPQTRETAIVCLADGIEAASRAMPDPTPARLKGLVQKMINHLFADGQLDECDLTLKDLNAIAKAFIRVLTSMYYTRPQYPGQEKNPGAKASQKRKDSGASTTGELRRKDVSDTGERKRKHNTGPRAAVSGDREGGDTAEYKRKNKGAASDVAKSKPARISTTGEFSSTGEPLTPTDQERAAADAEVIERVASGSLEPAAVMDSHSLRITGPLVTLERPVVAPASDSDEEVEQEEAQEDGTDSDVEPEAGSDVDDEDGPETPPDEDGAPLRRLGLS